ncbi:MAG: hypothetical protein EAX95_13645 [Candidatus Thorarchaeota archaeon]|nr:hypothetical protein [Candidatus Thorarchaeota archaeon]
MPAPKELEKLGGLFEQASDRSRPFLEKCSETKYLAITDYPKAADQYIVLAKYTLEEQAARYEAKRKCNLQMAAVKTALESGQLGPELVIALRNFKQSFFDGVLRPAVRGYLANEISKAEVESVYESAIRIDSLLEAVQFLGRVQKS